MKKKIIIGASIGIVFIAIIMLNIFRNSDGVFAIGKGKAFEVSASEVKRGYFSSVVSSDGVIEEVEKYEAYFDMPIRVKDVLVVEYENVKKGQKILELDLDELNSQYEKAKTTKTSVVLALNKLKSVSVARDIGPYENAVSVAQNNVKSAQSTYDECKKNYEKGMELFQQIAISQEELNAKKKSMDDAYAALKNTILSCDTAVANLKEAKKSNNESKTSSYLDIKTAEQNLIAADIALKDIEIKLQKIQEASVSSIDGSITQMNIKKGGMIVSGQPAFVVVNTDNLKVRAKIKEIDLKNVSVGQLIYIYGDAIDKSLKVTAKVTNMSPVAKTSKTTSGEETDIEVIGTINDVQKYKGRLAAGLNVTCDIVVKENKSAIVVSFEMLSEDKDGKKFVYVVDKKSNTMQKRFLTIGGTSDLSVEVIAGIKEGELIIDKLQLTFKDGARVKITNK